MASNQAFDRLLKGKSAAQKGIYMCMYTHPPGSTEARPRETDTHHMN